ncbi:MAG: methyl-accepting chemotaxis protein [Bacteroidales bacterium]|nr:methyl-accepting chemotaxis protein [Clostridium sp.]MCM1202685.1 methyl-accepting chemotaxis protein [Bacteroidales bacterium]
MTEKKKGMSIRKKLLFSYFSIVALILVTGIVGIYNVREVYYNSNEIYVNNLNSVEYLKSINQNIKEIDQCVISMMSSLDEDYHEEYVERIASLQQDNQELMEQYDKLKVTALEKRRYNQCRLSILTFDKQIAAIVEKLDDKDKEAALNAYEQELMPVKACTYELAEAVVELSTANARSRNENNRRIHQNLILIIGGIMGLSVIVAVVITIGMSNYFTNRLAEIQRLAKRISEYNIADDIQNMADDEFGQTVEALNDSQFMMRDLLEKIIDESAAISDTGEEVSLAVRKSGQRIERVNIQMLNSGDKTEQVDATVKQILENRSLDSETVKLLNAVLEKSDRARENLSEARAELSSIAMYLEQIAITSDYQNEIANSHKEQVQKFKV